jgi:hypothetical protein
MQPTTRFDLVPTADSEGERRSILWRDGRATRTIVPGCVLEAQYEVGDRALLFATHDIPYEEQLEIMLIDAADEIVDGATLVRANATGAFRAGRILDERRLAFAFFGDEPWMVEVLGAPGFRRPFSDPPGVSRRRPFRRSFILSR